MFVGTSSDAGKSLINTAFCRIFLHDGYRPAPFKAQNMSLNSYSTPEGGEIGRAQAVQAEACRLAPHTDMNPVLMKPTGDESSQIILHGKPVGQMQAKEYFVNQLQKNVLFEEVTAAFDRLAGRFNPIVLEGAGSISELNLRDRDITNMRMAARAGAATFLVTDIERGGVFASVYGSILLLRPEEKALMKGVIINKFRGDIALFDEGRRQLEALAGLPVVGVVPYFRDIKIEEEDSVVLERKQRKHREGKINVTVVLLRHLSNFTDFDALESDDRFHTYYTAEAEEIEEADIIVLPGSKNTLDDLLYLRRSGLARAVTNAYRAGKTVVGICGGYQMMGRRIEDPDGTEGPIRALPGLGLLPVRTVIEPEKTVRQRLFYFRREKEVCRGYEIHQGRSVAEGNAPESPVAFFAEGNGDGYYLNERCWGSYLHGILDNRIVLDRLAAAYTDRRAQPFDYARFKDEQYDKLARLVRNHMDMDYIYSVLEN